MRSFLAGMALAAALAWSVQATAAEDRRVLVALPPPMQDHMLANMRDHLAALDEAMALLASGQAKRAGEVVESRIGMSSLTMHGADHMGKFMPAPMRDMGMALHAAASKLTVAAADAEVEGGAAGQSKLFQALHAVTSACDACHQAYRIR